jgi:hypothetical protein
MRPRLIALGCVLTGAFGFLALSPPVLADSTALADSTVRADSTGGAALNQAALTVQAPAATVRATRKRAKPTLSISSRVTAYPYASKVAITVTLHAKLAGRVVSIYATPAGEARRLLGTGKVNARGKISTVYRLVRTTTFTAVFAGDARDLPATAHRTLDATARVAIALSGYFRKMKISGLTYDVYHGSGTLTLHSTVTPNKHGECLEPETEQFDPGVGWDADTKYGCDTLDGESHDSAPFDLAQAVGDKYRIRADYIRSARDKTNLSADSGWLYFVVVK